MFVKKSQTMLWGVLMKGVYLSFLFLFFMVQVSFALAPVGFGKIKICPGGCDPITATDPTDYVFNPSETGAACIAQSSLVQGDVKIYQLYCASGISDYEDAAAVMQNIVGVPVGTETAQARQAFNTWSSGVTPPVCAAEYTNGGIGEGYIFSSTVNTNPALSNINISMWKRRHCEGLGGGSLEPIGTIGSGSGGSTDMTATNALLTSIQTNTARLVSPGAIDVNIVSGGGGVVGVATDMTATNNLIGTGNSSLGSIDNAVSGVSTLPAQGVPAAVNAYLSSNLVDHIPTVVDYTTEYNTFKTNMEATSLYGLIAGFFGGVPFGGSSVYSFNGGVFGNHSYDFASWGSVMILLRGLTLVAFGAASLRIIFLKGGS